METLDLIEIFKDKKQKELQQKIIFSLCNLVDYKDKSIVESTDEFILEVEDSLEQEKQYPNFKLYSQQILIVDEDRVFKTNKEKERLAKIFSKGIIFTKLFNDIVFITLPYDGIRIDNGKLFIDY